MSTGIEGTIEDLKLDLEEANEAEDLETRLELSLEIARLEELKSKPHQWFNCGLCHGKGFFNEFDEEYKCGGCEGRGGNWTSK